MLQSCEKTAPIQEQKQPKKRRRDHAGTCIDPRIQAVDGRSVCLVSCRRSPESVFLRWKDTEQLPEGDLFVRSGPGTVKLSREDEREYVATRFPKAAYSSGLAGTN